ncbi:Uncharacterized protein RNJ44_03798 [Nakaseomyces bracarensis]|uniref:Uncharacterized protein n=1 Tax=Nakaseomyces bracarensis TaxID=273131 RepID=A0ABR4NXY2_9SACH
MTISWAEIKDIIASGELQRLKRAPEETARYHEHKRILAEQNVEIGDYILGQLGWSVTELGEINQISDDARLQKSFSSTELYKLSLNDFPYDFEEDVCHLLIWSKINLPLYSSDDDNAEIRQDMHDKIEQFIKRNLQTYLDPKTDDYGWFINYRSLQSIRGISHVHLLIRCPEQGHQSTSAPGKRVKDIASTLLHNNFVPI